MQSVLNKDRKRKLEPRDKPGKDQEKSPFFIVVVVQLQDFGFFLWRLAIKVLSVKQVEEFRKRSDCLQSVHIEAQKKVSYL